MTTARLPKWNGWVPAEYQSLRIRYEISPSPSITMLPMNNSIRYGEYLKNGNKHNYRNALLYLRHIATPHRWGHQDYEPPIPLLENMFYHREYGRYFSTPQEVTAYLKRKKSLP